MIDTIVLTIPKNKAIMTDALVDGLRPWDLQARTALYDKHVKNPSLKDKQSGLYFPRLTGYHRKSSSLKWESTLKIEFSCPKLLFGNNLDELADTQFSVVIKTLRDRLEKMGVMILSRTLADASVTAVHYSKNIKLEGGYTSRYVINELGKINLNKRFDFTRARYINDGSSLCAYTIAHSFIIYDKVADLRRSKKKSVDNDQSPYQLDLFEKLDRDQEILRFEVRLSQKQKIHSLFRLIGLTDKLTFKTLFSSSISQSVLNHYWTTLISGQSAMLFGREISAKDLLNHILISKKEVKCKAAIYLVGLLILSREAHGIRELRGLLANRLNNRSWYRIERDMHILEASLQKLRPREWYTQVNNTLVEYRPFRLKSHNLLCKEK